MTIYAKLLRLPFFQGIDRDELEAMASKIRFDFQKYDEGAWIAPRLVPSNRNGSSDSGNTWREATGPPLLATSCDCRRTTCCDSVRRASSSS